MWRPAKCMTFKFWQWPEPPGILLQGEPPIGGTGALKDSLKKFWKYFCNNSFSLCKGLEAAAPNCISHEVNKMMNTNKNVFVLLMNSIWLMNLKGYLIWCLHLLCTYIGSGFLSICSNYVHWLIWLVWKTISLTWPWFEVWTS